MLTPTLRAVLIVALVALLWLWTVGVAYGDFAWDNPGFLAGLWDGISWAQ